MLYRYQPSHYVISKETWMHCVIQAPPLSLYNIKGNLDVLCYTDTSPVTMQYQRKLGCVVLYRHLPSHYVISVETWMCCVIQAPALSLCNIKGNLDVLYRHQPSHYLQASIPIQHEILRYHSSHHCIVWDTNPVTVYKQVFPSSMRY